MTLWLPGFSAISPSSISPTASPRDRSQFSAPSLKTSKIYVHSADENAVSATPKLLSILACFFSGAAGLIYQVAWAKALVLVFGQTTYAVATALARATYRV